MNASFDFVLEVVGLSALGLRGRQGLFTFRWLNLVASKSDLICPSSFENLKAFTPKYETVA